MEKCKDCGGPLIREADGEIWCPRCTPVSDNIPWFEIACRLVRAQAKKWEEEKNELGR